MLRGPGDPTLLLPAEAVLVARAVPKRVHEFAAGRLCARRALAELEIDDFPIAAADDRQPLWPDRIVGSITHTAGWAAAVVAPCSSLAALGLDSEVVGSVNEEIWQSICGSAEMAWLASLPQSERAAAVTLIFSAKEAFYKCQYPTMREPLGFHDVTVEVPAWGTSQGEFNIRPTRPIRLAQYVQLPFGGKHLFHEEFVTAGIAIAAADWAQ